MSATTLPFGRGRFPGRGLRPLHLLLLALPLGGLQLACGSGDPSLQARQIADTGDLIGGPAAKGKVGDFLLKNDQLRAIVAGAGQTWLGNTFGGSLVDVDRVRDARREEQAGQGFDSFGETFPLVNLIITDPGKPMRYLVTNQGSVEVHTSIGGVTVLSDGSDGQQAAVRVQGAGAYLFQAIKFLNRDFLRAMIKDFKLSGMPLPLRDLAKTLIDPNLDLYSLINKLQLDFNFTTDYVVQPGKRYILIRTTVEVAPPGDATLGACPILNDCQLGPAQCADGLALRVVTVEQQGETAPVPLLCPACECAVAPRPLTPYTEQRSIFGDMLGDLDQWVRPEWRGGIVGGDFLFFGAKTSIFIPGEGFDDERRVFEDMWQNVGSLANPFVHPWLAGVGTNVSYGFTSVNPDRQPAASCPTHRVAVLAVAPAGEAQVAAALVTGFGLTKGAADGLVRGNIVDRNPILLPVPSLTTDKVAAAADLEGWRAAAVQAWWATALASWSAASGAAQPVPTLPHLAPDQLAQVRQPIESYARLGLVPGASCQPAEMMIPIFTTSATAVMTHVDNSSLAMGSQGVRQTQRRFTWERYLTVGDGDVASALEPVFALRGEPVGWVEGAVLEDESSRPVSHAHVFAVRDPRTSLAQRFASWGELRKAALDAFGNVGVVSEMQSDRGLDPVRDGDYRGPLPPGSYFLVAKTTDRRASRPVAVEIRAGRTEVAHLVLDAPGHLSLHVYDESGQRVPAKAVLVDVDEQGVELPWDGRGQKALGDARFDLGIRRSEFAVDGTLELDAEPGRYRLYVSRGLEYSAFSRVIELKPARPEVVEAQLIHEVDTTGYIAGDFHVHSAASVDAVIPIPDRVKSAVAEGLEYITPTDHDQLTDYRPYIEKMRLEAFLGTQTGVETTTLEFGHFNGYPMRYDNRDWAEHDPPPWFGLQTHDVFQQMRARASGDPADFVVQVNHPMDGFMGYLAQAGVHGYDLQRKTPGMELCNPQTEQIACDFEALEVMNEKRYELIRTPTVEQVTLHNRCYKEILDALDPARFPLPAGVRTASDPGVADTVCGWLQVGPSDCDAVAAALAAGGQTEEARYDLLDAQDRCRWAAELRQGFARCQGAGLTPIECKRSAIDALKYHSVRQILARTPAQQEAFRTLTPATDPGCKLDKATVGCKANTDASGKLLKGCGGPTACMCETCVCATHPECCQAPDPQTGVGGWSAECAAHCRDDCHGCGVQPCTDRSEMLDAWFTMLNQGFTVTGMGNSDSHNRTKEVGIPRNFVRSSTDRPQAVSSGEIDRAIRNHQVVFSTGPFLEMQILGGQVGDTVTLPAAATSVPVHVRVQTPSWFGVDRLEIYRNGRLEKRVRLEQPPSAVTDFDQQLSLPLPPGREDSWYVAMAYGLNKGSELSPVYDGLIYGQLLIPTVISIGLGQILGGFDSLMAAVDASGFGPLIQQMLSGAIGGTEMPDTYPTLPVGITNPIWVDADGKAGFSPPEARRDAAGNLLPPPFCAQPCAVQLDPQSGQPAQSGCGLNQLCQPAATGDAQGVCTIPVPANCPPDVFGGGGLGSTVAGLSAGVSPAALRALGPADPPWSATREVEHLLRRTFLGLGH